MWNRFRWFGFCEVLKGKDDDGLLCRLKDAPPGIATCTSIETINDAEALLIKAMGLRNTYSKYFTKAEKWEQVEMHEVGKYIGKLK
jgi:hypothetical protein